MTYVYEPGSSSVANAAGRLSIGGIQSNDKGTFITRFITGWDDTPDIRTAIAERQGSHGDYYGTPFYDGRDIVWGLTARAGSQEDLWDAIADLKSRLNLYATGAGVVCEVEMYGLPVRRATVVLGGGIDIDKPQQGQFGRWRDLVVPLHASDPRIYASGAATVVTVGTTATTLSNDGDYPSLPVIRIANGTGGVLAGPFTVVDAARGRQINVTISLNPGDYVELDGLNRTAIRSTDGGNVRSNVTRWDEMDVNPGGVSWTQTGGATVTATYRHAWV